MGKTILVVDDSSIMRKMIKSTLKSAGHDVVGEAKNGQDAVALYKTLKPELVTMEENVESIFQQLTTSRS